MAIELLSTITPAEAFSTTTVSSGNVAPGVANNRILLVACCLSGDTVLNFARWRGAGGTDLLPIGTVQTSTYLKTWFFYLLDADIGDGSTAGTIYFEVDVTSLELIVGGAVFSGVDQATPLGSSVQVNDTSGAVTSPTITSATDEIIVDMAYIAHATGTPAWSPDAPQTLIWAKDYDPNDRASGMSYKTGAASTTMQWSGTPSPDWGGHIHAVPLKPAASGPAVSRLARFVGGAE